MCKYPNEKKNSLNKFYSSTKKKLDQNSNLFPPSLLGFIINYLEMFDGPKTLSNWPVYDTSNYSAYGQMSRKIEEWWWWWEKKRKRLSNPSQNHLICHDGFHQQNRRVWFIREFRVASSSFFVLITQTPALKTVALDFHQPNWVVRRGICSFKVINGLLYLEVSIEIQSSISNYA